MDASSPAAMAATFMCGTSEPARFFRRLKTKSAYSAYGLAFHPDGKRLAAGLTGGDDPVRIWDLESGEIVLRPTWSDKVAFHLAYNSDGTRLAGNSFGGVRVWDAQTGNEVRTFKSNGRAFPHA